MVPVRTACTNRYRLTYRTGDCYIDGKKTPAEEVNAAMKAAANESEGYNQDEIVSSDIIGGTSFWFFV